MTPPPHSRQIEARLAGVSEDEILDLILPMLATSSAGDGNSGPGAGMGILVGPGDDAAVVEVGQPLVVTTDSMIRDRDWRDDWSEPGDVAAKLGAQNISDIAAMGAVATAAVLTITADPQTPLRWVLDFAAGLGSWCADAGVAIVGGDLSSAPAGVLQVSLTMWGDLRGAVPVVRSGARPGDVLAVCGSLGWSSAGLDAYTSGVPRVTLGPQTPPTDRLRESWRGYHRRPRPPWESGPLAAAHGATSMIDVSDGLVRDLTRVARASAVGIALDRQALASQFLPDFTAVLSPEDAWRHVLSGGEEHSLVATFPLGCVPHTPDAPWRVFGAVVSGSGITLDGEQLSVLGWDHFAQE